MQYAIKSGSSINRIEITVKLTNHSVLCYIKNSLKVLKSFCNLYSLPSLSLQVLVFQDRDIKNKVGL